MKRSNLARYPYPDLSLAPLQDVATYIEDNFTLYQIQKDWFEYRMHEEMCTTRIKTSKWLRRIQEGAMDEDDVESMMPRRPFVSAADIMKDLEAN